MPDKTTRPLLSIGRRLYRKSTATRRRGPGPRCCRPTWPAANPVAGGRCIIHAESAMPRILNALKDIQHAQGWIPEVELKALSDRLNVPLYHLQGLASFYPHFRLTPPARVEVRVCQDLSCHLGGSRATRAALAEAAQGHDVRVEGIS